MPPRESPVASHESPLRTLPTSRTVPPEHHFPLSTRHSQAQVASTLPCHLARRRSDLVQLTLWLMYESSIGASSEHRLLLSSLPSATLSPLLWTKEERADLLQGSPLVKEIEARLDALHQEWYSVIEAASVAGVKLDEEHFTTEAFVRTFCVVLAHAIYLPSAECFALVPLLGWAKKTGARRAFSLALFHEPSSL